MLVCKLRILLKTFLRLDLSSSENRIPNEFEDWKLFHEIGHGIVAHVFDGYLFKFQKVTLKLDQLERNKIHPQDSAYTIALPIEDFDSVAQSNMHKAALVDGLYLLSGVAGASFLSGTNILSGQNVTAGNFKQRLNLQGANGDFDIIRRAKRPYGWFLNYKNLNEPQRLVVHSKLVQILYELFSLTDVQAAAKSLLIKIKTERELLPIDFQNEFDNNLTQQMNKMISDKLLPNNFGEIG